MDIEHVENDVVHIVPCPDCDHEITVKVDWREGDTFPCPNCDADLQVMSLDPIVVDFAPEDDESWDDSEDLDEISLEEAEEIEIGSSDDDEEDEDEEWSDVVPRRVATLRAARSRPPVRKGDSGLIDDGYTYLTPEGEQRLRDELDRLKTHRLPRVTAWLADALSEGFEDEDVTEIEEARSELSLIEGRIRNLEILLATSRIMADPESREEIQLGSRVTVVEGDYEPETYRIVSSAEADPLSGYLSHVSPLGKQLMGRHVGDQVEVASPDGPVVFRITEIQ
jgi:transcription elongation factor GreA